MMRPRPRLLILTSLFALASALFGSSAPPVAPVAAGIESLAWMAGHWGRESPTGREEELWLPPAGGVLLGLHRDVGADGGAFFEFLRVEERGEGLVYLASPLGREATAFTAVELGERRIVFENRSHDFPRRIAYWREGDRLHARVEGAERGVERAREWVWPRLADLAAPAPPGTPR